MDKLRFTDAYLRRLKVPPERKELIVFEAKSGLGVRVSPSNISFIVQLKMKNGRRWRETLGAYGKLTVAQARDAAQALAGKIALGVDLAQEARDEEERRRAEAEQEAAQRFTVRILVDRWAKDHLSGQRVNYGKAARQRVIRHFPDLIGVPAMQVDRKQVRRAVEKTRDEVGPGAARNSLVSLKAAFKWALAHDLISTDPLNGFALPPKTGDRERVLSLDEARAIWAASFRLDYPGGHFVRLLFLSGCRRNEISGLRWDEIGEDDDGPVIAIPSARTKTGAGHRIPLSSAAVQTIEDCRRWRVAGSPYVLTNSGHTAMSNTSVVKARLDGALDRDMPHWVFHDARRSLVTYLASKGYDPVVIDLLLGHAPSKLSPVARIYQKFEHADTRREMVEVWANALNAPPAEVIALKTTLRQAQRAGGR
jgi:integrase